VREAGQPSLHCHVGDFQPRVGTAKYFTGITYKGRRPTVIPQPSVLGPWTYGYHPMKNNGSSHAGEPGGTSAELGSKQPSGRIPVVDDDTDIRRRNTEAFSGARYDVNCAAGGRALNANRHDLLITDSNTPKITGRELIN
jgi:hypothetical protein